VTKRELRLAIKREIEVEEAARPTKLPEGRAARLYLARRRNPSKWTWNRLEVSYGLRTANGINAWRVYWSHVVLTGKTDPLPKSVVARGGTVKRLVRSVCRSG
jgi:hypothetical protein